MRRLEACRVSCPKHPPRIPGMSLAKLICIAAEAVEVGPLLPHIHFLIWIVVRREHGITCTQNQFWHLVCSISLLRKILSDEMVILQDDLSSFATWWCCRAAVCLTTCILPVGRPLPFYRRPSEVNGGVCPAHGGHPGVSQEDVGEDGERRVVRLAQAQLRVVPMYVGVHASRLQVIDLHGNFLTDLSPLEGCIRLVKLDVHDNQIAMLPGPSFWAGLLHLRVLYLHGNAIGGIHGTSPAIAALGGTRTLQVLTLQGNPLALVRGYRTYVINVLWSLRALDGHVVSDGEIIEGARESDSVGPLQL